MTNQRSFTFFIPFCDHTANSAKMRRISREEQLRFFEMRRMEQNLVIDEVEAEEQRQTQVSRLGLFFLVHKSNFNFWGKFEIFSRISFVLSTGLHPQHPAVNKICSLLVAMIHHWREGSAAITHRRMEVGFLGWGTFLREHGSS